MGGACAVVRVRGERGVGAGWVRGGCGVSAGWTRTALMWCHPLREVTELSTTRE